MPETLLTFVIAGAFKAALAVFFCAVYFVGCILIVVVSPKICKGIFAGSCGLGALVGGALTAITATAMGMGRIGVATGAFGSGTLGQIASGLFDTRRGGRVSPDIPTPDPSDDDSLAGVVGGPGAKRQPVSMEAILATGVPAANRRTAGGVSQHLAGRGTAKGTGNR
jgi:hypothetical protein